MHGYTLLRFDPTRRPKGFTVKRLRAYLRVVEIRALRLLRQPHRYDFDPPVFFYAERVSLTIEHAVHRVQCARGQHVVKFDSWPDCIYCGRVQR